ncbi:hypothetical protein [Streptomyces sp. SID5473]
MLGAVQQGDETGEAAEQFPDREVLQGGGLGVGRAVRGGVLAS